MERRRPTVYQVAERAGVSIATVSRALRDESTVAPATRQKVLAAAAELELEESRQVATGRRRPTVYQVAERAGVSIATVSRALRDEASVAPATRERIRQVAIELNWWPSRAAQALAGDAHDAVAIVFPDLAGPYYAGVIAGFESDAVHRGSAVMVLATHGRSASEQLVRDLSTRVDGVVIMDQTIPDATVADIAADVPVILLARPALPGIPSVRSENTRTATRLTEHMIGHGLRNMRFLGDLDHSPDVRQRWDGFVAAHEHARLPITAEAVNCDGFEPEDGYRAALGMIRDGGVDAIMCANDELASGVYLAAAECELEIPGDLAVTGWDDVGIATHLAPRLTTARQPVRGLGETAARMLFDRIEARSPSDEVIDSEVIVRESCGCHPAEAGAGAGFAEWSHR